VLDDAEAAPDMVEALVAEGSRVRAVVPLRSSLEELFVELVEATAGTSGVMPSADVARGRRGVAR